jgi:hypothetical protein
MYNKMGSGQSCKNVSFSRNRLCDIGSCVKETRGMVSNSSSRTDIMFLKMKNGTTYEDRYIPDNKELTLKLFLDPEVYNILTNDENRSMNLLYETDIYEKIIAPMIHYGINPHFVKYYGRALRCSADNVAKIIEAGTNLSHDEALHNVMRNSVYMTYGFDGRPSITKSNVKHKENGEYIEFAAKSLGKKSNILLTDAYGMMLTEKSSGVTFNDDIQNSYRKMEKSDWISFIQILSALEALSLFECSHSDLHLGNIFINDKPNDWVRYTYFKEGKNITFKLKSDKTASLFDWDRSYSKYVGVNKELADDASFYNKHQQSNEYIPPRDMLKVMVYMTYHCKVNQDELFNLVFTDSDSRDVFYSEILSNPNKFYLADKDFKSMSFDNIKTPGQMLFDVLKWVHDEGILSESELVIELIPPLEDDGIDAYNSSIDEETIRSFINYSDWEIARDEPEMLDIGSILEIIKQSDDCKDVLNIYQLNSKYKTIIIDNIPLIYKEMRKSGMVHRTSPKTIDNYQQLVNICLDTERLELIDKMVAGGWGISDFTDTYEIFEAALIGHEEYEYFKEYQNIEQKEENDPKYSRENIEKAFLKVKDEHVKNDIKFPPFWTDDVYLDEFKFGRTKDDDVNTPPLYTPYPPKPPPVAAPRQSRPIPAPRRPIPAQRKNTFSMLEVN